MKLRFVCLAVIAVIFFRALPSSGQEATSSMGTDFWFQFMPNGAGAGNTSVYEDIFIATPTANNITVSGPISKTFVLKAGQVYDISLTDVMNSTDEVVQSDAIHITSLNPIAVYGFSAWGNPQGIGDSPDGFLALPTDALGTEYYTVNFPDNYVFGNMPGEFLITSPYNNNIITITPAATTKSGRLAGVPWTDTLQQGQTYLVQSPGNNFGKNDLTGTLIKSSKPISVLTGHQITSVPSDCGCFSADNLFEMVPSVDRWGTQYFDMPMAGKTIDGDYIRVLSAQNGNTIAYTDANGTKSMTLDSGQYEDVQQVVNATVFTSTNHKRFLVAQYSYSQGVDGDPGYSDPFLVLFTPKEQFEKEMVFRTPTASKGAFTNYATVIAPNDSISKITINGLPLSAFPSAGNAVFSGTTPLMGARRIILDAHPYNYVAKGPVPFAMYQYGFSNNEGYGWPSGMLQRITNSNDTLPPLAISDSFDCGKFDVQVSDNRTSDTHLADIALIQDAKDVRWPKPSYNYAFTLDSNFVAGNPTANFHLNVIDLTQDAYAAVWTTDRAGNDTVYQYFYTAPKISPPNDSTFDFGTDPVGNDYTRSFELTNKSSTTITISSIRVAGTDTSIFTSPSIPLSLQPGNVVNFAIGFSLSDTVPIFDTVIVTVGCAEFRYPLHVQGTTPIILAGDVDFGGAYVGDTVCQSVVIQNIGNAPLIIFPNSLLPDTVNFTFVDASALPDTIAPHGYLGLKLCFHPTSSGKIRTRLDWQTNITGIYAHQVKDTSTLVGVGDVLSVSSNPLSTSFELSVTPNPTRSAATISISGASTANVVIFDVLGREITSFHVNESYKWNMASLSPGTYIVRAEVGNSVVSKRIIKE